MKKYEMLFELIKSLSRSEKRYFKLYCGKEDRNGNYLRLFEVIDAQVEYNERDIKNQLAGARFTTQLHVTKIYLYKLILKTLRNFHEKLSQHALVKNGLCNVEILFNKELYEHCRFEINSLERICQKFELTESMVEIQNWKRKLRQALEPFDYPAFREALEQQKLAIRALDITNQYWNLAIEASLHPPGKTLKQIEQHKLLSDDRHALNLESRVLYHNTSYLIKLKNDRGAEAQQHLTNLVEYLENMPDRINQEPGFYVSSINNLLSFLVFNRQYNEGLEYIKKAKSVYDQWKLTTENRNLLKQIFRTYNIELEIYRTQNEMTDILAMVDAVEKTVFTYRNKMPKEYLISFWFQFASIYFMQSDFDRALHWVNQILNSRLRNIRQDLTAQTHLLNLMVHFEQQNLFVLRYFVDSTRRFLKKGRSMHAHEKILLKFFIKISRLPASAYKEMFRRLKADIFPDSGPALVPDSVPGHIHYRRWIDKRSQ